jgi:hypothetical protein
MSTGEQPRRPTADRRADEPASPVPVAPDRPVVAGEQVSAEELRTAVAEQSDERRQQVEELRDDVAATMGELVTRLDLPARARARTAGVTAAARGRAVGGAASVRGLVQRPAVLAVAGAALLVVLARVERSRSRARRGS